MTKPALSLAPVSAPAPQADRFYAPEIDGLRFLAALMVIIHHSPVIPGLGVLKEVGWAGVDLFLCISAFLLTRLIRLEIRRTGSLRIRHFFIRRALRIWPLYLGYAAAMTVAGIVYFHVKAGVALAWMLSHLSFSNNLMAALNGFSPVPFTGHLWTISLEEQAYLVIPFFLLAASRAALPARRLLITVLTILTVLTIARISLWLSGVATDSIFVLPTRADALVIGAATALLFEDRALPGRLRMLGTAAFLAIPILLLPQALRDLVLLFIYPVVGIIFVALLLVALAPESRGNLLGSRPMRYLGKISYGIYVFHPLCIVIAEHALASAGITSAPLQLLVTVALTIVIAGASYRLYETPFLHLKERFAVIGSRPV